MSKSSRASRRRFLKAALLVPVSGSAVPYRVPAPVPIKPAPLKTNASRMLELSSPDGNLRFDLLGQDPSQLKYRVSFQAQPVIEASELGIMVDSIDLGKNCEITDHERYTIDERFPWRGVHSQAVNHCNGARISLRHPERGTSYALEVRVFNDGVAFRYLVPAGEKRFRVPEEATVFSLPHGSVVWFHDFEGHYEGIHAKQAISEVEPGAWAAPPLTVALPNRLGFAAITEGALFNYAGMVLQADEAGRFRARLGHAAPLNYPFKLRYGEAEHARLSQPAAVEGTILSPWRVVMIGADLNALVNCDILAGVSPAPDPELFPDGIRTGWIRPGRCVWSYLNEGERTLQGMKEFSRLAGELGFEYNLVEGFWQRWSPEDLRDLVAYSRQQQVGIWLWKHRRDIMDAAERRSFFKLCRDAGVAGVKLDFYDHEAKEVVELYATALRDAAEFQLMVDFHGANKPTGEARTWPNEMTREGVFGLEYSRMQAWAGHNTTLPFTRMLAGHADYTPMHFGERRRETSWPHQIASAAILTSPLLILAAHPRDILDHPAVEMIRSIPSVWDETIVLPVSSIGQIAAFARRHGERWFLAIMNGPAARSVEIPLSFLEGNGYEALLVRDQETEAAAVQIEHSTAGRSDVLKIALRAGGGFIGRFSGF